jgi:hypothetical protein
MANRFRVRPAEVPLLHPQEQVFTAMLDGWRNQQLAVNLAFATIEKEGDHGSPCRLLST